jgi:hypothetical protein
VTAGPGAPQPPLAESRRELTASALVQGTLALASAAGAVAVGVSLVGVLVLVGLVTVAAGLVLSRLLYRRVLGDALAAPRPAPRRARREPPGATLRRVALREGPLVLVVALMGLLVPGIAGLPLGNALALLAEARRVRRWEEAEGARLLRRAVYRWRAEPGERPRGNFDTADFFRAPR